MKKVKNRKNNLKNRLFKTLLVVVVCIASIFGYSYIKEHRDINFTISSDDDFYVLGYNGITAFSYRDGQLQETSDNSFNLIEEGYNYVLHRARIQDRYLMFTDASRFGDGRVISVDF